MIINDVNSLMRWKSSPLPTGFTLLNYLESDGTQYVTTGLKLNNGTPFKIKFRIATTANPPTSLSNGLFGARGNNTGWGLGYFRYNSVNYVALYANGTPGTAVSAPDGQTWHSYDYTFEYRTDGGIYLNDNYVRTPTIPAYTATSYSYIFKWNFASVQTDITWRIYEFETTGCHIYPAMRDADSVVGMYDVVQNVFRTNQGSGTFTYG